MVLCVDILKVTNDTGQTIIIPFFKPIAYGLILLRSQGQPCVFYGDLYGLRGGPASLSKPACSGKLPILMQARKLYAYGEQRDYFDKRHCIGKSCSMVEITILSIERLCALRHCPLPMGPRLYH